MAVAGAVSAVVPVAGMVSPPGRSAGAQGRQGEGSRTSPGVVMSLPVPPSPGPLGNWARFLGGCLVLLLACSFAVEPARAGSQTRPAWNLEDGSGHRLAATLFEKDGSGVAGGLRLRLNPRSPGVVLDHARPLRLEDSLGGHWNLANRSDELVPPGTADLPPGSAQFDLSVLQPVPAAALPLQLTVPTPSGVITVLLAPARVQELHDRVSPTPGP
jgi:hypothetical protein